MANPGPLSPFAHFNNLLKFRQPAKLFITNGIWPPHSKYAHQAFLHEDFDALHVCAQYLPSLTLV